VIGTRSYGKGSVQGIFPLGYAGAGARITTAKFFSPMGHPISNVGVTPDIDARRATLVTNGGEQPAGPELTPSANMHQVGFRGTDGASAPADATLDLAIEVAQNEPVAQL
jgi:carboxyl-terminal processing protease